MVASVIGQLLQPRPVTVITGDVDIKLQEFQKKILAAIDGHIEKKIAEYTYSDDFIKRVEEIAAGVTAGYTYSDDFIKKVEEIAAGVTTGTQTYDDDIVCWIPGHNLDPQVLFCLRRYGLDPSKLPLTDETELYKALEPCEECLQPLLRGMGLELWCKSIAKATKRIPGSPGSSR